MPAGGTRGGHRMDDGAFDPSVAPIARVLCSRGNTALHHDKQIEVFEKSFRRQLMPRGTIKWHLAAIAKSGSTRDRIEKNGLRKSNGGPAMQNKKWNEFSFTGERR